jgi:protein required for attachment to host cells
MNPTWIVVADEGRARFFERRQGEVGLVELEGLIDPLAHARGGDLSDSRQGRLFGAAGSGAHTASPRTARHDVEAAHFAAQIVSHLVQSHAQGLFQQLQLAAAPRFLGVLRQSLPSSLAAVVTREWDKDWLQCDAHELAQRTLAA